MIPPAIPDFSINYEVVEWQHARFASLSLSAGNNVKVGEVAGNFAYEPAGYPGPRGDWSKVSIDHPAQHRSVAPMEFVMDLDINDYPQLKASTERIMSLLAGMGIRFDVWSTAGKSYHIHSAYKFGPDFKRRFSELPEEKKFGARMFRSFMLSIADGKVEVVEGKLRTVVAPHKPVIDPAPVEFSDEARFSHLIRAEMGPRKVGGNWYYKSLVTTSEIMYLPPVYPRAMWPPESLPPSDYPLNVFPSELTDALFEYAEMEMNRVNMPGNGNGASHVDPGYTGRYFNLPCIRSLFSGRPIERHSATRGGNKGAKLVAVALCEDTKRYAETNAMEKATKISREYRDNLVKLGKGDDFGPDELKNWYQQARRSNYRHNCGEVIKAFTTPTFNVIERWCAHCPYDGEKRAAFRDSQDDGSNAGSDK